VHFMGIGGVGMCGLAEIMNNEGIRVSGCDLA
jgi:UDP-N-acetylmuramate--alanine ligase